ncbi:BAG family molecular chaperone regulator Bag102 [Sugiyamaella lignohabitans]|uniref:BAG family molecular chaperone regulator Bag102 n=1 Tax=Sugiyamaella lignohabitans TaxID=796027 RepID=A0A167DMN9_9ASCO|nr:BAG family molecular chaperone regulator Bag102 [Sugiyamaella lignohabitans]ANB13079.1 BAG family molecular chaperone regulator Bag102 [Sugiyamaella lignohabitans]
MFKKLSSFLGWSGEASEDNVEVPEDVRVQYQKSMYAVKFDKADAKGDPKGVTVGFLRAKMGEILECDDLDSILLYQISPEQRRLVDNDSHLTDYGIMTGDRLLAILSTDKDAPKSASASKNKKKRKKKTTAGSSNSPGNTTPARTPPPPPTPKTPQEKIKEVLESTDKDLGPHIEQFISSPPKTKEARADLHHRLSEMVLQKMFLLDDVDVSDSQELRQARKSAINTLHSYHSRLDEANKRYEEEDVASATA